METLELFSLDGRLYVMRRLGDRTILTLLLTFED